MAFPTTPALDALWTEGGIDYKFDGVRWRPLTLSAGGGLTVQQQKIISALFTLANRDGELLPPVMSFFTNPTVAVLGAKCEWYFEASLGLIDGEDVTAEFDWGGGEPYQVVTYTAGDREDGLKVSHTFAAPPADPVRVRLTNAWGVSDWVEWPAVFSNPVETWTVTAAPALDGGPQPTRESLAVGNVSDPVYYSAIDETYLGPTMVFDFGAPVAINQISMAGLGYVTITDGVVDLTRCELVRGEHSVDGVEWTEFVDVLGHELGPFDGPSIDWRSDPVMNDTLFVRTLAIPVARYVRILPVLARSYMVLRAKVVSFAYVPAP